MECSRVLFDHLAWIEHQYLSGIREGRKCVRDDERCWKSKEVNTPELIGQRVKVRVTMLRLLGSSGKDSVGSGQHSSNQVSGISTRTMHQSTTPSPTIWPRWASKQFLSLPIVDTLLPLTFAYSLWDIWGDERGCNEGHWHTLTRGLPWGLPKYDGSGLQVDCSRRRLLRGGLEFNVCTINKSAHAKKVLKLV